MPKVSVVLSVYNGAETLADALETTLGQSCGDFELLAIDDGSTDESLAILNRYAQRDPRVHVFRNAGNRGVANSLNTIIPTARGEYIMLTDADDLNLSDRLERQLSVMETHPEIGVVSCFVDFLFSSEADERSRAVLTQLERTRRALADTPEQIPHTLVTRNVLYHGEVMYRKQLWMEVGGYRPELSMVEDYDLWLRMIGKTAFHIVPRTLYIRRYGTSNVSHTFGGLQQFTSDLAVECYWRRAAGQADTEYARAQLVSYLQAHGLTGHFARYLDWAEADTTAIAGAKEV